MHACSTGLFNSSSRQCSPTHRVRMRSRSPQLQTVVLHNACLMEPSVPQLRSHALSLESPMAAMQLQAVALVDCRVTHMRHIPEMHLMRRCGASWLADLLHSLPMLR